MKANRNYRHWALSALTATTIMALSLGESGAAYAKSCASDGDYAALSLRVLQSDLMVAGLRCRAHSKYASFVQKFGPELKANGGALKKFFNVQYGGKGTNQLDVMVTRLANDASSRAGVDTRSYCGQIGGLFDEVLSVDGGKLINYATTRPQAGAQGFKRCANVQLAKDAMQIPGTKKIK